MKYLNIVEKELEKKVAKEYFQDFDTTKAIGNIDFSVRTTQSGIELFEPKSLLWAEAKPEIADIHNSFTQLILTIGKARTFDKHLPPPFLGAIDAEKIVFIPYNEIHDVFYINDFNWNVRPSDPHTKEFGIVYDKVKDYIDQKLLLFYYDKDDT